MDIEISPELYALFVKSNDPIMRDHVIMRSYQLAIENNAKLFRDAVVLEIACGSGILSMWAAKCGASRVIAIEPSPVAQIAQRLITANNLGHIVKVLESPIEDIAQLPDDVQQVDVIICKWMGACLLYNSAIESVIYARDKWLKSDGNIFPQYARLFIAAAEPPQSQLEPQLQQQYWQHYNGFNLSRAWRALKTAPLVTTINGEDLLTSRQILYSMDMRTVKLEELNFNATFQLSAKLQGFANCLVTYFDFAFPTNNNNSNEVNGDDELPPISTSPFKPTTQWKQTIFWLDKRLPICENDLIIGEFRVQRQRHYLDFNIEWSFHNNLVKIQTHQQHFRMQGEAKCF